MYKSNSIRVALSNAVFSAQWPDHIRPNAIPFAFRIGIWVFGGANGSYSVCSMSMLALLLRTDAYGTAFGSYNNLFRMFKIIFIDLPNHPNVASMCIREVFGKHSRSMRHVRKTSGKHASRSGCIRNENLEVLGSVWFPNSESILKPYYKHSESKRKTHSERHSASLNTKYR